MAKMAMKIMTEQRDLSLMAISDEFSGVKID